MKTGWDSFAEMQEDFFMQSNIVYADTEDLLQTVELFI